MLFAAGAGALPAGGAESGAVASGVARVTERVFAPTDLAGLRQQMHRRVVVEGTIVGIGESATGSVRYLNFTRDFKRSVSLVFFSRRGGAAFSKEMLGEYVGKKVRVGGLLSDRNGALQIKVEAVEHIRVLP